MPHHEYPDAEGDKYPSLRLAFPNTFFSPEIAQRNYQRYLDEYEAADQVGFDGLAQAASGNLYMSGPPDQPSRAAVPYVDFSTATIAAFMLSVSNAVSGSSRSTPPSIMRTNQ